MDSSQLNRRLTTWAPKAGVDSHFRNSDNHIENHVSEVSQEAKSGEELVQVLYEAKTESYQWESNLSYSRYKTLLELKHPHIIEIDGGEWLYPILDDLPLPCTLRVTKPPQPRTVSVHDLIMSEGFLLISDAHHMCTNILAALEYLSQRNLVMGKFTAKHIACTSAGYKIMNVDKSHNPDQSQNVVDLRSVGHVLIEMLTRKQPGDVEVLTLTKSEEPSTDCESFLAIASKQVTDLKTYREHLVLLKRQLATWKHQGSEKTQLKRLLRLSNLPETSMCSRRPY